MNHSQAARQVVGYDPFRYEVCEDWARLPSGWSFGEVVGIATDSRDRVFVYSRSEHPVTVFDRDGNLVDSWGEGRFTRPHGIHIGPDDDVYLTDDQGHSIFRFTSQGKPIWQWGNRETPSGTGVQNGDYRTIQRSAGPFNMPTNVALAADGTVFVTDGYGNARVHKFSPDGQLLLSWGSPGTAEGAFHLPHGIAVSRQNEVYVADRENSRVQIFDSDGQFLRAWNNLARPTEVFIAQEGNDEHVYISELGFRAGLFPGAEIPPDPPGSRVSIFRPDGQLLCRWGGGTDPCSPGDFFAAHDLWADARGDLYVSEVTLSAGGNRGLVPRTCHTLQKFLRIP